MFKVLLIDDEMLDLEGLERLIPWGSFDMEVVGSLNSGFEALEYLKEHSIDILVSDIKMPIMSGLELARKALSLYPKLRIIFVSGYEDFQYAKQAIQLNANGYVLKPINDEEMFHVLREVRDSLIHETEWESLRNALSHSMTLAYDEIIHQWLEGKGEYAGVLACLDQAGISLSDGPFQAVVLELDDVTWKLERHSEKERLVIINKVIAFLLSSCKEEGVDLVCRMDLSRMILILQGVDQRSKLERIRSYVEKHASFTVTMGIGQEITVFQQLPESYQTSKEVLAYKIFCGKNRIITMEDTKFYEIRDVQDMDELLQTMFAAITSYDLVKVSDSMEEIYSSILGLGKKMTVYNVTLHIISKLDSYLSGMNENLKSILGIEINGLDILYNFETVYDIQSWLRRRLFEISEMLQLKKLRKNRKLIDEIEQFVIQNMKSNLTLRDVANFFAFSPNYLGHLFKEENEENFSDFVIRKRLERAKEMLKDPKLKVYEIADQVGYKSLTYFSKQFREKYGLTPGDYRKQS